MRHRVRLHAGPAAASSTASASPPEPELESPPPHGDGQAQPHYLCKQPRVTSTEHSLRRARRIPGVCHMPALKIRRLTPQWFGAWVRVTRRRYGTSPRPARKGEIRVSPGRKRVRLYREIMELVLMSVRE